MVVFQPLMVIVVLCTVELSASGIELMVVLQVKLMEGISPNFQVVVTNKKSRTDNILMRFWQKLIVTLVCNKKSSKVESVTIKRCTILHFLLVNCA